MACLTPFVKKNPNYGLQNVGLNFLKDTVHQYINIPCGYCANCIAVKQMYLVQRVQMESLVNHLFFATLTYNNDFLPSLSVGDYDLPYADLDDVILTIKRIREGNLFTRPFRYFLVSELGSKRGRPHFHCLFLLPKYKDDDLGTCLTLEKTMFNVLKDNWTCNISGDNFHPVYRSRFTYAEKFIHGRLFRNYDLHYCNPSLTKNGVSDVAFYVLKYMLKDSSRATHLQQALRLNYSPEEYEQIWSIVRPSYRSSLGFGLGCSKGYNTTIVDYLRKCVERTPFGSPYPFYFNPDSGQSFPLCPYYRSKPFIYTVQDALTLYYNFSEKSLTDLQELYVTDKVLQSFKEFRRKVLQSDSNNVVSDYFDDFD